jgi:hypothetical protein
MIKDSKTKSYNPLIRQFEVENKQIESVTIETFRCDIREKVEFILIYTLSEAQKAFELLDTMKNESILKNILEAGLIKKTDEIMKGSCQGNEGKSV